MTPLEGLLIRRIEANGPLRIMDYMAECLLHPEHGYYTTAEPFGAAGDFITSPEISQMFGELLGLWLAQCWLDQGAPTDFTLAEIGPGRGTLMADILRATRNVPGFHQAARICLVEASPRLRDLQAQSLGAYRVSWHAQIEDLPQAPLYLVANEFLDALPIRQFQRNGDGWAETMVAVVDGALRLARGSAMPLAHLAHRLADTHEGDIVEICPALPAIIGAVSARIADHGGAALLIDYGGWHSLGDTLQAMRDHKFVDLLDRPGQSDLTAHVDFEPVALAARASGLSAHGPVTQGDLLNRLGLPMRRDQLARGLGGAALERHLLGANRLTAPDEMGSLFKALALLPPTAPQPAGFAS